MQAFLQLSIVKRILYAYLVSLGVYTASYAPVLAFTFIGLSSGPSFVETNLGLDQLLRSNGLVSGLLIAYLTSLGTAGLVVALTHIIYYRPVVFVSGRDLSFSRKVVALFIFLLLLFWGWTNFLDAYGDLRLLIDSGVWNGGFLWTIFLSCLSLFLAGLVLWASVMLNAYPHRASDESKSKAKL